MRILPHRRSCQNGYGLGAVLPFAAREAAVNVLRARRPTGWRAPLTEETLELKKRQGTEETIPMKETWHGHSAFCIEVGGANISSDPFLSDNPSRDNRWSGYLTGKNSRQGGDR